MAIHAYVGLPRSGKSYDAVANQILPALQAGRRVVTNIPLHEDRIRESVKSGEIVVFPIDRVVQEPDAIFDYITPGSVAVLDEVWRLWPAGQKADKVPKAFKELLAEHGHMVDEAGNSCQIVLVTQDLAQIAAFARQLVEQTVYHTKMGHVGLSNRCRVDIYHGSVSGNSPPRQHRLREIIVSYDERIWRYYKSHTKSQAAGEGANEKSLDGRGNIWKRPMLWVAVVAVLVTFVWGGRAAYSAFHDPGAGPASGASGATAASGPPGLKVPVGKVAARPQPVAKALPTWRVSGAVQMPADPVGGYAWLTDGLTTVWVPLSDCKRSRFELMCVYAGAVWSDRMLQRPPAAEPIGTVSDASLHR